MENQIYLYHRHNIDQNFRFYKKLEKLGFILDEGMVEHPGKNKWNKYYLEFVSF